MDIRLFTILWAALTSHVLQAARMKRCYVCRSRGSLGDCESNGFACLVFLTHSFPFPHPYTTRVQAGTPSGGTRRQWRRRTRSNSPPVRPAGAAKRSKERTAITCKRQRGSACSGHHRTGRSAALRPFTRTSGHPSLCASAEETYVTLHQSRAGPFSFCHSSS